MKRLLTILICSVITVVSMQAEPFAAPYRYGEDGYGYVGYRNPQPPVWHRSGLFEKRDLMNSVLYGAFGLKYDRIGFDGVSLNTYGGYVEFCNIMLDLTYRETKQFKAYDSAVSFLLPIHPNFRLGPRLEYAGLSDKMMPYSKGSLFNYDTNKFNVGLTVDMHFRYFSIIGNVSRRGFGIGVGWAFGRI